MTARRVRGFAGVPCRVLRVSFTGASTFEINVPAPLRASPLGGDRGRQEAGSASRPSAPRRCTSCAPSAAFVVVGQDTDGTVTPIDLGMERHRLDAQARLRRQAGLREHQNSTAGAQTAGRPADEAVGLRHPARLAPCRGTLHREADQDHRLGLLELLVRDAEGFDRSGVDRRRSRPGSAKLTARNINGDVEESSWPRAAFSTGIWIPCTCLTKPPSSRSRVLDLGKDTREAHRPPRVDRRDGNPQLPACPTPATREMAGVVLGLEIPVLANRFTSQGEVTVFWLGPDEWLLQVPRAGIAEAAERLRRPLPAASRQFWRDGPTSPSP